MGDEFQVNTYTYHWQKEPSVTVLEDDGFVVTWHSYAQDASNWGVYGQRFDAAGKSLGEEFLVNSYEENAPVLPVGSRA